MGWLSIFGRSSWIRAVESDALVDNARGRALSEAENALPLKPGKVDTHASLAWLHAGASTPSSGVRVKPSSTSNDLGRWANLWIVGCRGPRSSERA